MPNIDPELELAFRQTVYWIDTSPSIQLRLGKENPELLTEKWVSGAFMTAYNPQAMQVSDAANEQAHQALMRAFQTSGFRFCKAWTEDPSGEWPREDGVFIWEISSQEAQAWGRQWDQAAVVWVDETSRADLLWIT